MTGNKVYVYVTDQPNMLGGGKDSVGKQGAGKKKEGDDDAAKYERKVKKSLASVASIITINTINTIESEVAFNANNYGYFTGNYIAQREEQKNSKLINSGLGIASSFVSALIVGGSLTAGVTGLLISSIGIAVSSSVNYYQNEKMLDMAVSKADKQAEFFAARSGLASNSNWSRGTED